MNVILIEMMTLRDPGGTLDCLLYLHLRGSSLLYDTCLDSC